MLVRFTLVNSLGPSFKRCVQPDAQVRVTTPTSKPRTDNDTWPQRSPYKLQVGKKIKDPGFIGFLLDLIEPDLQVFGQIAKRVVHHVETQRLSDIVRRRRVSAATVARN